MAVWSVDPRQFSDSVNKDVILRGQVERDKKALIKFELSHGLDICKEDYLQDKYGSDTIEKARAHMAAIKAKKNKQVKSSKESAHLNRSIDSKVTAAKDRLAAVTFVLLQVSIFGAGRWDGTAGERPQGPM